MIRFIGRLFLTMILTTTFVFGALLVVANPSNQQNAGSHEIERRYNLDEHHGTSTHYILVPDDGPRIHDTLRRYNLDEHHGTSTHYYHN